MFVVQPHGSYCSWTSLFSECWDPLVGLSRWTCRRLRLSGQKRIRWLEAPQYRHSPLVRRWYRSAVVSGARARSISIGIGSLNDVIGEDLTVTWGCTIGLTSRNGDNLEVTHSSCQSSKRQFVTTDCFLDGMR